MGDGARWRRHLSGSAVTSMAAEPFFFHHRTPMLNDVTRHKPTSLGRQANDPTEEQIAERSAEIRSTWSDDERLKRMG